MKYAIQRADGIVELREDSSVGLPAGALPLTDDEFASLLDGADITAITGFVLPPKPPHDPGPQQALDNGRALRQRNFEDLSKTDPAAALLMLKELIP